VAIVGDRPETGVRIAIERPHEAAPPWSYEGAAYTKDATVPIRVVVGEDGTVTVSGALAAELAERVRLIVRAAYKQARADGEPPARRIVRWRAPSVLE
jgi:hypothetical protein